MHAFRRHYRLLIEATLLLTLVVVALGAYVRLSDAGLGCPDWPGCYGQIWVDESLTQDSIAQFPQQRGYDATAAQLEMLHRFAAGVLGLMLLSLAAMAWRLGLCTLSQAVSLVALLTVQVILGMLTVTWLLKPIAVTAHLFFAFALASTLWLMHAYDRRARPGSHGLLALLAGVRDGKAEPVSLISFALLICVGVLLFVQIFLGVWMSSHYASLACTGFPKCNGQWWPVTDFARAFTLWQGLGVNYEYGVLDSVARVTIHWGHRLNALILTVAVLALVLVNTIRGTTTTRRLVLVMLVLFIFQLLLGMVNIFGGLPIINAVAHTVVALLLVISWIEMVFRFEPSRL